MTGPSDARAAPSCTTGTAPNLRGAGAGQAMSVRGAGAAIGHLGRAARDTFPKRISKNPDGKSLPSSAHGASTGYDWLSGQAKLLPLSSRVGKHPVQHQYNRTAQSNLNTPPYAGRYLESTPHLNPNPIRANPGPNPNPSPNLPP
ncbi:hypothetical protein PABG_07104 [Paracoccidioides brasiliensis Pb03]|nr:hypothetical protein PABG_07104 [Paracoccidioides brasiliensis Pb03]